MLCQLKVNFFQGKMPSFTKKIRAGIHILLAGGMLAIGGCSSTESNSSIGDLFAAFPAINSAINLATFRASPRSGITKNQQFEAFTLPSRYNLISENRLQYTIDNSPKSDELKAVIDTHCGTKNPADLRFSLGGLGPFVAIEAANLIFNSVFDQLSAKVDQIRKASQQSYQTKIVIPGGANWNGFNCVLLARTANDRGKVSNGLSPVGLNVLLKKIPYGQFASTFEPIFIHMDHAIAITGKGKNPGIKLDIAFAIHASDQIRQRHSIYEVAAENIPPVGVSIGDIISLCPTVQGSLSPCRNASPIFPNPTAKKSSAVSISFSVVETGSAAKDADAAKSGIEAIKTITKPKFDELLARLINE